ncbi:L-aspartate oxidase [Plantibacter sp. VKM Ac-2880]|uniref:L-aspartate oxidase n=1 Tax=Plantibacter sp. VKM Ac-2880 TaxID=2783827 RepID=UPI00188E4C42|nr:L-aspartate oxidase [Plantibacter sp. VKM Ac-2880]MBF4568678.1 L-aspartate oxidase [Plantibacter sp. VKM Ac-2880]
MARVLVVGSGIAGLVAAIRASERHDVVVVTKDVLGQSNTRYAQGGIAGVMFDDDRVEDHVRDTLLAGAGLCDEAAVRLLCTEGPDRIRELIAFGVAFDRDGEQFAKGLEAAHSYPRVLHAGGDATGAAIETALVRTLEARGVPVLEHTVLLDLDLRGGVAVGAHLWSAERGHVTLPAEHIVLATGGVGQLYPFTTNPSVATGDGAAVALRAGALLADVEFVQFHPTALTTPERFLVSEAVRGEGAVLRDAAGHRFMHLLHPDAELAPRDVVARGIAQAMAAQGGRPVTLDATALGAERLAERFPGIDAHLRASGVDWSTTPVEVAPAAHYWMGGVATDLDGRTTVPGLYAIGEVARTGVHGANRLASNSLLEGAVFAARAVAAIDASGTVGPTAGRPTLGSVTIDVESVATTLDGTTSAAPPFSRQALHDLMWRHAGLVRNASGLTEAQATLAGWAMRSAAQRDGTDPVSAMEDRNLLLLARAVVAAALQRTESRGAHARDDHPAIDVAEARPISVTLAPAPPPSSSSPSPLPLLNGSVLSPC